MQEGQGRLQGEVDTRASLEWGEGMSCMNVLATMIVEQECTWRIQA